MKTIGQVLVHFTIGDYARLQEQAKRAARAQTLDAAVERKAVRKSVDESAACQALGYPEYHSLKHALHKKALYEINLVLQGTKSGPDCPMCGRPMIVRRPKAGKNWLPFWGCRNWSRGCRGKQEIVSGERLHSISKSPLFK